MLAGAGEGVADVGGALWGLGEGAVHGVEALGSGIASVGEKVWDWL